MIVSVKCFGMGLLGVKGANSYTIDEGSTIDALLKFSISDGLIDIEYSELRNSIFLINKMPAKLLTELHDEDDVLILRPLGGG